MDMKGFFRPGKAKLISAVVIFIVLSFLPIVPAYCVYRCPGCAGIEYGPLYTWCDFVPATYLAIFIELVASYILACLVASARRKRNKGK